MLDSSVMVVSGAFFPLLDSIYVLVAVFIARKNSTIIRNKSYTYAIDRIATDAAVAPRGPIVIVDAQIGVRVGTPRRTLLYNGRAIELD